VESVNLPAPEAASAPAGRTIRVFAAPRGQPRVRRATDLVLLVPSLLGLGLATLLFPPTRTEATLERLLAELPSVLRPLWGFGYDLLWLGAAALVVAALAGRRFVIVAQALAALALAAALGLLAARAALDFWPPMLEAVLGSGEGIRFPNVRVAASTAVLVVASPHFAAPVRRVGRWILVFGVVGAAVVSGSTPLGTVAAVLIALAAAAAVNLVTGTSAGRPGIADVLAGLAHLGVHARNLRESEEQIAGVLRLHGRAADGTPLTVQVYGRDTEDNQLVAKLWRRVWYRGAGASVRWGRIQAAEHEAVITLLAGKAGLAARDVVTVGETPEDDALLVLAGEATPLGSLGAEADVRLLEDAWRALGRLEKLRIAHQQLDPASVMVVDGRIGFASLGGAVVAPGPDQLGADRAQLFVTTVVVAGRERATDAAVAALGHDGFASLLPYLQPAAFPATLRRALKAAEVDVDELRKQAAGAVGVEPPELVNLRRVSPRSAIQLALLTLASYTIISAASGVNWGEVVESVRGISWAWVAAAFLVAQLPRLTQAVSTLGSVPAQLPFGPVYAMQLATGYMNVALPSSLARMAVNIRFFQRQGLSPPTSVASGAIDSFASSVIQVIVLLLLLLFSGSSVALELPTPSGDPRRLMWILLGVAAASLVVLAAVPRLRNAILGNVRRWWPDVRTTLVALRSSHKLAQLVLGSLATEILFAVSLGMFARAFGYDLPLVELVVIVIGVSLLGTLVPIPGNIGVAELGLSVGLTGAGMTPEAALAAVLLYRMSTFYIPPLWGFVALQWLQRNRHL
jgi:glycosyltransferase 2 family protein